ncbi:histidine phosphatase family protein [Parvibaculum sedimenti]|uniref:Histidine phosphatase family protein n=1 Tax=Parvibaculum sedimenti TaxID=2608632 RepID=A0A6N6VJ82_9HYPH|nr:histidine phosphatase family protein [Parvibaculum sedimenti]KAB7740571.1 histidine phosphatase family protein [Parvibaculum sedimenti]
MPTLYMIRHGEAASGWDADMDPGLSEKGRAQSEAVAREIEARVGKRLPLISSPLRRCRETSEPLARTWSASTRVDERVGEIPSPVHDLKERGEWLRSLMAGSWNGVAPQGGVDLHAWRRGVVEALVRLEEDTVIFSHFVAINVAAGAALFDERVILFKPDNCSVTVFETRGTSLSLVEKGREAETKVN